jgi:ketosteroid isomerase-like protein
LTSTRSGWTSVSSDADVVRRAWAAFNRGDEDAIVRESHPDLVAIPFGAAMEGKSYSGHEGILEWWHNDILATWEVFEVHPEHFQEVGDKLLVTGRWKARGIESGVDLDIPAAWVIEVREGQIAYWQTYTDLGQARRDVGLDD